MKNVALSLKTDFAVSFGSSPFIHYCANQFVQATSKGTKTEHRPVFITTYAEELHCASLRTYSTVGVLLNVHC